MNLELNKIMFHNFSFNLFVVVFSLLSFQTASADFDIKNWEYKGKIDVKDQVGGDYISFDLPASVFEKLRPGLEDIRVASEDGEMSALSPVEVPYVLTIESGKSFNTDLPSKMYNLGKVLGRETSFIVDLNNGGALHSQITVETSSENFKRGVKVYGSDDLSVGEAGQKGWQLLNDKGQIFDYTNREGRYTNSRFMEISYPESTLRYLKVVIDDTSETPLNITGAKVGRMILENAREISYTPTFLITQNEKDKTTDIVADLGAGGIPSSRGEIETGNQTSEVFGRGIVVSDSDDKSSWQNIARGYIFSVSTSKFTGSNLGFSYPESRKRYLKVSILNRDDGPLQIDGINLFGVVRKVWFKQISGKKYYLYLGNDQAKRPEYDVSSLSQYVNKESLRQATLGEIEKNKKFVAPQKSFIENHPNVLTSVLLLVVLLLFCLVVRLFV